ncbi:MAG TPA: peptidylprolyl isomerase [Desulforhopalus sp.]|nr:peptidylprolyl isomerase [Desulforhopalus sp.]
MKQHDVPRHSNRLAGALFTALLAFLFLPAHGLTEVVDRVVAIVNEEIITLSELEEEAAGLYSNIAMSSTSTPILEALAEARNVALNNLIDQRLITQRAKQQNIGVSVAEIDAAYERIRASSGLSAEEFSSKIELSGLTEEKYRDRLRLQALQGKLVSLDVHARIAITDEMVREAYLAQYAGQAEADSYYLLQMGFSWTDEASREQTRQRAEEARDRVREGGDFKSLARELSDLPSAEDGGDIGLFSLDEMAVAMRQAVSGLQPGDLSEIIETPAGYQFFQVLPSGQDATEATTQYEAVKESIRARLQDEKLKEAYAEWVKKLKEDAYIQKL